MMDFRMLVSQIICEWEQTLEVAAALRMLKLWLTLTHTYVSSNRSTLENYDNMCDLSCKELFCMVPHTATKCCWP